VTRGPILVVNGKSGLGLRGGEGAGGLLRGGNADGQRAKGRGKK
jgi:hypothetical protein